MQNDGTSFFASQNAQYYYDENGQIRGTETLVRDITEQKITEKALKESEQILRSFFDSMGDMRGIVEVVAADDVRHISDNVITAGFLGLKPQDMRNKLGSELGEPPEILSTWIGHYVESMRTGKPVTFEYNDIREDNIAYLNVKVDYLGKIPAWRTSVCLCSQRHHPK